MYCKECGINVEDDAKFCSSCGTSLQRASEIKATSKEEKVSKTDVNSTTLNLNKKEEVRNYINKHIKSNTVFVNVEDFIKNSKPLKFRMPLILLGACFYIIGAVFGWLVSMLICTCKMMKLNAKKYTLQNNVDLDDLTIFLSENLDYLPFKNWQRGTPSFFGLKDTSVKVIQFVFEEKTIHRIEIKDDNSFYRIKVHDVTKKSYWKNGGQISTALLYKNAYRTQPIIEAALEYYLNKEAA